MSDSQSLRRIELSDELVSRIEDRIQYTEFETPSEYIEHILEEVLYHVETTSVEENREAVDEDEVQERLKSLGYLNE
jgi:Arc/MetJ-type ribon-helix-helix transcriptional regulator